VKFALIFPKIETLTLKGLVPTRTLISRRWRRVRFLIYHPAQELKGGGSALISKGYYLLCGIARGIVNLAADIQIHQVPQGYTRPEQFDRNAERIGDIVPQFVTEVAFVNRGLPLPRPMTQEIKTVAREVLDSTHPCGPLLQIAESLVENPSAEAYELMKGILNDFQKADPRLTRFFYREIITTEGCNLILDKLREKSGSIEARVCSSAEEWGEAIQDIYNSREDYSGSFIVNATPDKHLTHIHVTKTADSFDLFFTDSMGYDPAYLSALPAQVQNLKGGLPIHSYQYKKERQSDGSNCPVFSIRDSVKMCRDPSLTTFIKENSNEIEARGNTRQYEIRVLPPAMMKVTQSMVRMEHYISNNSSVVGSYEHLHKVRDESGAVTLRAESFRENIDKHLFKTCVKKQNKLIEHRFNKYAVFILRHLVQNPPS
jgi:hypothetical protein